MLRSLSGLILLSAIVLAIVAYPSAAIGGQVPHYSEYWLGGLRVVLVDPRTPDLVIRYKGLNYVDFNTSNDYATLGPRVIPGLNMAGNTTPINSTVLSKAIGPVAGYLENRNVTGEPVGVDYPVVIHRDYSTVEVVVNPDKDPLEASMPIAKALKPLLLEHGYTTLIVVRELSGTPFTRLSKAAEVLNHVFEELVDGNYTGNPPVYLQRLAENIRENPDRMYLLVGTGVYGSVVIDFWGPKPNKTQVYNMVKWIRDKAGPEYSDVPVYIVFHSGQPPKLALMTFTVTHRTITTRPPPSISYSTTGIILTIGLAIVLMAVILKRKY